jgi:hypothetical protein
MPYSKSNKQIQDSAFKMKAGSSPIKYFWEKKNVREARKEGRLDAKATRELKKAKIKSGEITKETGKKWMKKSRLDKKQRILDAKRENI